MTLLAGASASLTPAMRALVAAVGEVRAVRPAELPAEQALTETAVLLAEVEVLRAVLLARLADVETRQLHALVDSPSTGAWVAAQGTSLDRGQVALARRFSRMPAVADEVLRGRLTVTSAERVGRALDQLRRHVDRPDGLIDGQDGEDVVAGVVGDGVVQVIAADRAGLDDDDPLLHALLDQARALAADRTLGQLARLERAFVLVARHVGAAALPSALGVLVDAVLPVQHHERVQRRYEQRGLRLVRLDDGSGWRITRGDLDLETGELLSVVLAAARATDPEAPLDTAAWASEDGPLPRSRVEQEHDALRAALRLLLDTSALGVRGKAAPHVSVTISLPALHRTPGALPAVTDQGSRLPLALVEALLPDSRLTRFVLTLGHRVVETSHTARTLTATERRVLELQWDHRCADAHCHAPPGTPLVPHHAESWASTGRTSLEQSVPFCARSHRDLHLGGHTLLLRDGRRLHASGWVGS